MNSKGKRKIANNKRSKKALLDLSNCNLSEFPKAIFDMPWLTSLTLGTLTTSSNQNKIQTIPQEIVQLINLESLNLRCNKIRELPDFLFDLKQLKKLYLWANQLREIPESIGNAKNLEVLGLYNNKLLKLPNAIEKLTRLKDLDVRSNKIREIPNVLKACQDLEHLSLDNNSLNEFPLVITELHSLTKLSLNAMKARTIPPEIRNLKRLKVLSLSSSELVEICDEIGELEELEELELFNNRLKTLPKTIVKLKYLRVLSLGLNNNLVLPPEIGALTNLEEFSFQHMKNGIKLPPEIANLKHLKDLNIRDAQLTTIPYVVFYLTRLDELDLNGNKIKLLPPELSNLKHLSRIDLEDNPLDARYDEPLMDGTAGLMKYLEAQPQSPLPKDIAKAIETQRRQEIAKKTAVRKKVVKETEVEVQEEILEETEPIEIKETEPIEIIEPITNIVEERIAAAKDKTVKTLDLSNTGLSEIPEAVFELTHLETLHLSSEQQSATPNNIVLISDEITQLKQLKTLNLAYNLIKKLPKAIEQIQTLETLNLKGNLLERFPMELFQLKNLKSANLKENKAIDKKWIELAEKGYEALTIYQEKIQFEKDIQTILEEETPILSVALKGLRFSWFIFRNKNKILCEICKGGAVLTGYSPILKMNFESETCYGCEGTKIATYEVEGIHEILHRFNKEKAKDKILFKDLIEKWRSFEVIYKQKHENESIVADKVKSSMNTIRQKYLVQIEVFLKRFPFYNACLKKLHVVLFNQHLINIAIEEHRKLGLLQEETIGQQGNIFELTGTKDIEEGMVHEMDALSALMKNYPDIYLDFRTEIQKVIEEFKAIHF